MSRHSQQLEQSKDSWKLSHRSGLGLADAPCCAMSGQGLTYRAAASPRPGFTLVELLITISIIGIMAATLLSALGVANGMAKEQKTKALIAKIDGIIKAKYDSYRTRRVSIRNFFDEPFTDNNGNGVWDAGESFDDLNGNATWDFSLSTRARMRLDGLRELMRLEMPDTWKDVEDPPVWLTSRPAVSEGYFRKFSARTPTPEVQSAECLYMIVMAAMADDADARDAFKADNSKDTDNDGYPEFIDGWGKPIRFIRWPVGFPSDTMILARGTGTVASNQLVATGTNFSQDPSAYVGGAIVFTDSATGKLQGAGNAARIVSYSHNGTDATFSFDTRTGSNITQPFNGSTPTGTFVVMAPDPYDPRGIYPFGSNPNPSSSVSYATYPLIYSAGSDGEFGIKSSYSSDADGLMILGISTVNNNPFAIPTMSYDISVLVGATATIGSETYTKAWVDNIHNQMVGSK